MSKILHILASVNETVNVFELKPKRKYTEPKIYTGGIDVSKCSNDEKEKAIKKQWFVYFSYLNPKADLLEKQSSIKRLVS